MRGMDGWLAVGGLISATLEYYKISLENDGTMDERVGDRPRWQFHGQNLQYNQLDNLFVPAELRMVGWMV